MGKQVFINYWIGQEPCPPSPTLDKMPAYVDIVPLAFIGINTTTWTLGFDFLEKHASAATIQGWIKTVRANGTKVLFSINDTNLGSIPASHQQTFINNVVAEVAAWGVDGIDFDYESSDPSIYASTTYIPLIQALRHALKPGSVFTAPIYGAWLQSDQSKAMLKQLGGVVDWISTMDYTSYIGYDSTISACEKYASIIGGWSKLVIGVSCMDESHGDFTPIEDVVKLTQYNPPGGKKGGVMLYTYSYDIQGRTQHPDGTWTLTIQNNLPAA